MTGERDAIGRCPCCGGAVAPTRLYVDLRSNRASRNGIVVHLKPRMAEILHLLNASFPAPALHEVMMSRLFGADGGPDSTDTIKVHISQLRRRIDVLGMAIEPVWGTGYQLLFDGAASPYLRRGTVARWSDDELADLERMVFVENVSPLEAARRLHRSPGGAAHKLAAIALRRQIEASGGSHADAA